jgi:F-type H+-transporting ATPase subunit a
LEISVQPESIEIPFLGEIHFSVLICTFVVLLLSIFCVFVKWHVAHRWKEIPGKFQLLMELGIEKLRDYARSNALEAGDAVASWVLAMGMLIAGNCLIEFFSFEPPTADLSMTLALGILTFLLINVMGVKYKKLSGRLRYYITPTPIVAPFKLLGDLAVPVSLGCRLYGNVLSGVIIMGMIYSVVPLVVPAALSIYFTLFHALIQTYIFITLTLNFVREAVE